MPLRYLSASLDHTLGGQVRLILVLLAALAGLPAAAQEFSVSGELQQFGVPVMRRSVVVSESGTSIPQTRELISSEREAILRVLPRATGSGLVVELALDGLENPVWLGVEADDSINGRPDALRRLRPAYSLWTAIDASPGEWRVVSSSDPYRRLWRRWLHQTKRKNQR